MRFFKFLLLVLLATLSLSTTAQENNNKKSTRQERKLERQERREKRKEERKAKRNETTNDTVYIEVDTILQDNNQSQTKEDNKPINQEVINQQEEIGTPYIESTPVKVQENTIPYYEQSKSNSPEQKRSASSSELSSDNSQDENINGALIIIAILICVGIFKVIRWYHMHKCSSCKRRFSMKVVNEEFLGHTKKKREKGSDGKYFDIYYSNIKVTRQCKYCGHKVFYTEERKGDKGACYL